MLARFHQVNDAIVNAVAEMDVPLSPLSAGGQQSTHVHQHTQSHQVQRLQDQQTEPDVPLSGAVEQPPYAFDFFLMTRALSQI